MVEKIVGGEMRKRLKDLNVAEVACFLRDERLKVFVDMVVEEEVGSDCHTRILRRRRRYAN